MLREITVQLSVSDDTQINLKKKAKKSFLVVSAHGSDKDNKNSSQSAPTARDRDFVGEDHRHR